MITDLAGREFAGWERSPGAAARVYQMSKILIPILGAWSLVSFLVVSAGKLALGNDALGPGMKRFLYAHD